MDRKDPWNMDEEELFGFSILRQPGPFSRGFLLASESTIASGLELRRRTLHFTVCEISEPQALSSSYKSSTAVQVVQCSEGLFSEVGRLHNFLFFVASRASFSALKMSWELIPLYIAYILPVLSSLANVHEWIQYLSFWTWCPGNFNLDILLLP